MLDSSSDVMQKRQCIINIGQASISRGSQSERANATDFDYPLLKLVSNQFCEIFPSKDVSTSIIRYHPHFLNYLLFRINTPIWLLSRDDENCMFCGVYWVHANRPTNATWYVGIPSLKRDRTYSILSRPSCVLQRFGWRIRFRGVRPAKQASHTKKRQRLPKQYKRFWRKPLGNILTFVEQC